MKVFSLNKVILSFFLFLLTVTTTLADEANSASINFNINVDSYLQIDTVTNAVLTAVITDRTGNLYAPLQSRFKVISNCGETKTLYLKANTMTDGGYEEAMFMYGGRVYIAFANLTNAPTSSSLANCKLGTHPKESPGVVAYPVTSIIGAKHKFVPSKNKYEVYVDKGITNVSVNVGANVLKSSFASNDPKGFYQATLSLTEADI